MRVAITGGAGFVGSHLTKILLERGHEVTVLDALIRQVHGERRPRLGDVRFVQGDVRDGDAVSRVLREADAVVHLAALTGVGQSMYEIADYTDVNCTGTAVLMDSVVRSDVSRVVLASSRAVYGEGPYICENGHGLTPPGRLPGSLKLGEWNPVCVECGARAHAVPTKEVHPPCPTSVYGATKLYQEEAVSITSTAHHLDARILRLFNVYGPGQSLHNPYTGVLGAFSSVAARGDPIPVFEDGRMKRDFVHVRDVVRALAVAVEQDSLPHGVHNVGYGTPTTILDIAQHVAARFGAGEPEITGRYRVGDIRHSIACVERMEAELGVSAETDLAGGIRDYVEWFAETGEEVSTETAMRALQRRGLSGRAQRP